MAIFAFDTAMRAAVEQLLIDIEEAELTGFVDTAQTPVFMTEHTVEFIVGLGRAAKHQQDKRGQHVDE